MSTVDTLPVNRMRTSSRQSLTWSAHNAAEECRNSNVKGDAAETGLLNGKGRTTRREARLRIVAAMLPGRRGELRYLGRSVLSGRKDHHGAS